MPVAGVEQLTVNEEDDKVVVVIVVEGAPQAVVPLNVKSFILNVVDPAAAPKAYNRNVIAEFIFW